MKITAKEISGVLLVGATLCFGLASWDMYQYYALQTSALNPILKKVNFELNAAAEKLINKDTPSTQDLQQLSNAIGKNGYLFILSQTGTVLMHPRLEYVTKNIKSLAKIEKNKALAANISAFLEGSATHGYFETKSRQGYEINMYKKVPGSKLIIAAVIYNDDALHSVMKNLRQFFIIITSALVFMLLLLFGTYALWQKPDTHKTRIILILVFVTLVSGIGLLWHNEQRSLSIISNHVKPITNQQVLEAFTNELKSNSTTDTNFIVKTGIFLKDIQYTSTSQLNITGYIWQRYPTNFPPEIERDFLLPDCSDFKIKDKISYKKNSDGELIVWLFSGTFNQQHFHAIYFPFDDQDIHLEFKHPSLNRSVLLVPDLGMYHPFMPRYLPGIQRQKTQSDHFFVESFFAYRNSSAQTIDQLYSNKPKTINLYFAVIAGRGLISIIITYLLPVLLALATLFSCLILTIRGADRIQTIGLVAAVFLAITLLHGAMRTTVGVPGVISYLEYYYLLLYVVCCFVLAYTLMYKNKLMQLFEAQDALLIRKLFFPTYLLIMFIITAILFY